MTDNYNPFDGAQKDFFEDATIIDIDEGKSNLEELIHRQTIKLEVVEASSDLLKVHLIKKFHDRYESAQTFMNNTTEVKDTLSWVRLALAKHNRTET